MAKGKSTADDDGGLPRKAKSCWAGLSAGMKSERVWDVSIEALRDQPGSRLALAVEQLPYPAAFRNAAVAVRAEIRAKRKAKEPFEGLLALLYRLAAIDSLGLDYSERLKQPGFNVMESIPARALYSLPVRYRNLGYSELKLLNKTDVKWLVAAWGEPDAHSTLNRLHRAVWDGYEDALVKREVMGRERFRQELRELAATGGKGPVRQEKQGRPGCLLLFVLVAALLILALIKSA